MLKVKAFFPIFIDSLLPHYPYYHTLLKEKFSTSVRYFLTFLCFAYILFLLLYAVRFDVLGSFSVTTANFTKSLETFPTDLVISLREGKLNTNINRPYFMWMDYKNRPVLVFVIDKNATPSAIEMYKSVVLLTGKELVIRDVMQDGKYKIIPFTNLNMTIDKAKVLEFNQSLKQFMGLFVLAVLLIILIILPFVVVITNLLYLLIASIVVFVLSRLYLKHLTLSKTMQLAIHAVTLPILVNYGLGLINMKIGLFPFAFFILVTVFVAVAVYESHLIYPKTTTS